MIQQITSMEPGFLKPGNRQGTRLGNLPPQGHFNGAGLPEARKPGACRPGACEGKETSMEPGFLKPGNRLLFLRLDTERGEDFNGAGLPEARKRKGWRSKA